MEIRLVEAELFHADGQTYIQTDRQRDRYYGTNNRFSEFCRGA